MEDIDFLEFNELIVIDGSDKYLLKNIKGHKIEKNTTILVGEHEYDLGYILPDDNKNHYRLINSNETIVVELK